MYVQSMQRLKKLCLYLVVEKELTDETWETKTVKCLDHKYDIIMVLNKIINCIKES